jgi:hypothetical protein
MKRILLVLPFLLLAGCDQLKERMGLHDPAKLEAEGKAVGAACRNAGLGLEDCFRQNPDTGKAAVYAGWKEMNEYMAKNNMQVIPPLPAPKAEDGGTAGHEDAAKDVKPADAKEHKAEMKPASGH